MGTALIIGALLTAIGSGFATYANYEQNQKNLQAQQTANEQNIQMQYDINNHNIENAWKMWNATNEYNKPVNQMERFKEAGLNPNLIYGQTNTTSPVSIPSAQAPQVSPVLSNMDYGQIGKSLHELSKVPFLAQQIDNMQMQNRVLEKQGDILYLEEQSAAANAAKAQFEEQLWLNLKEDPQLFETYYKSWVNSLIEKNQSPGVQNAYRRSITSVQGVIKALKDVDLDNYTDMWEMKLKAMEIANQIDQTELDWKEFEKAIGNASGVSKIILTLVKSFLGH